jgi:hypothetical protein
MSISLSISNIQKPANHILAVMEEDSATHVNPIYVLNELSIRLRSRMAEWRLAPPFLTSALDGNL